MYFYPEKVKNLGESLERKKEELELYQEVIDRTFTFVTERINENENKQQLITELNQYVGNAIDRILEEEKAFYDQDVKDRLRVPPFNFVKRQPRDYTEEINLLQGEQKQEYRSDSSDDEHKNDS